MNFKLTLTLAILVLLLASLFIYLKDKSGPADKKTDLAATPLIDPAPTAVKAITLLRDGKQRVAFTRVDDKWKMTFPVESPVEGWTITDAADTLKAISYKDKFEPTATGPKSPEATGTQSPRNTLKFTDDAGKEYTLALGKKTVGGIFATFNGGKTIYLLSANPLEQLDKDPQEFRAKNIKSISADKVVSIKLQHGDDTVSLAKADDHNWLISAPVSARANAAVVQEILNQLKSINASGFSEMAKTMPATGLTPPVLAVTAYVNETPAPAASTAPATASAPAGTPTTLEIGYYTDLTNKKNVYASIAGSPIVFTLSADAFTKLNREFKDLRDPAVTPAPVAQATEFTITPQGKPPISAAKKEGKWTATSGAVTVPSSELEIGDLLVNIRDLRAIKFVDHAGDLKSIGLDPPQMKIELTVPNQSQHEILLVGKPETDVAGGKTTPIMRQGEPTVYMVQSADADKLLPTPLTLRDKNIERLPSDKIRGITITGPAAGPSVGALEREGTSWKAKTADGKSEKVDDDKLTSLLADFTPLTAAKFLAENATVSGNPDIVVTVTVLEPAATPPATSTAPATTSAPAIGPELGKMTTHTLKLFKSTTTPETWKALWEGGGGPAPQWLFEPTPDLITHLTKETYAIPTTQPATQPTTVPAK